MISYKLSDLAELLGAELKGDATCVIHGIASLESAKQGELCFLRPEAKQSHLKMLSNCQGSAVLLTQTHALTCSINSLLIDNPELAFARALSLFYPQNKPKAGIHATAQVAQDCSIDVSASIGPYCVIGSGVTIGANSVLEAGVVIGENCCIGTDCYFYSRVILYHHVKIGHRVMLHGGAVIGSDGFGLVHNGVRWEKIPQIGTVIIGNDVEIGANTTIDRGALDNTVISNGVKIDNQVQIGHNVRIGEHTAIAGCSGIAGSTEIGNYCMIGGGANINGHIKVTDGVIVGGASSVVQSLTEPGFYASGVPVLKGSVWRRNAVRFKDLDAMMKRLRQLEKNMEKCCDELE